MSTRTAHKPRGRSLLDQPQIQSIRLLAPSPSFAAPWLKWRHQPSCVQHNPLETLPDFVK
ncbi:MAG: hypothetical protein CL920_27495 [Deltaproteobacteria bacterium]|nr:hypothetical protein [Deltaproteobacteria bacterium]MBU52456.1 hypothetical protein [Deltaproteobacteria bacterium]